MTRKEILDESIKCVCETRDQQYGSVYENFSTIAELWQMFIFKKYGRPIIIKADDVGIMMALLKIARIASGQVKEDNFIDCAGYIACAGEIATKTEGPNDK